MIIEQKDAIEQNSMTAKKKALDSKYIIIVQIILMMLWGAQLIYTDAYYVVYALLLIILGICTYRNIQASSILFYKSHGKYNDVILYSFSVLFSFMVALANYKIWASPNLPEEAQTWFPLIYKVFLIIVFFVGGFVAFGNIFSQIVVSVKRLFWHTTGENYNPGRVFLLSFTILVITRLIVLFFCRYPGELTPDSINQMEQIMTGAYNNHHPFYHTMIIKFFVTIGMRLFNDINAAAATYHVFQILFTAMCFSYAVSTMAIMKTPKWIIISSMLFYILMPYHIIYAVTMWKDIMFGCFVLLLVTFVYRCLTNIGNPLFDYVMLTISSLGTCLFRSNGFFAFVILTAAFFVLWRFRNRKMLIVFCSAIVISFIMKHAVLAGIGVTQPDTIESLSIPAQQIARVVQEGGELEDWQAETLGRIVDIDQIPEVYKPYISDPVKDLVREKGNQQLLVDQKDDYVKLYLSLGRKYPLVYARAWIDQTRGYWNAGYGYWRWLLKIYRNDMGIERSTRSASLNRMFLEYLWIFSDIQLLRVFLCIGLFVWLDIVILMIALLKKDKLGAFVAMPILVIVASLLVATPVFSEFRYIYAAFCCLPMVAVIALRPGML